MSAGRKLELMTTDECNQRASACAANASMARSEPVALEFMRLAAQWRAMAVRLVYVGPIEEFVDPFIVPATISPLPTG